MSRIGQIPIKVPSGVEIKLEGNKVQVKGPKGSLSDNFKPSIKISHKEGVLELERSSDEPEIKALHGLTRALLNNMVIGVTDGFSKTLELVGVGYRVQQKGKSLTLSVMFSHPVNIDPLPEVDLKVDENRIIVTGINKQKVGEMAAQIRKVRPPNAYTGKGIRYLGEYVRIKPGKSARAG
ncbi:MAG: 50S ribosomal protein L6 [Chloroflexi bacterium]|nr:50S ribosomal protein L6 [Chloroflexota bacterium]MCH2304263.1 50S ribosomal protein L6 [SAR202 cluster bacterium]